MSTGHATLFDADSMSAAAARRHAMPPRRSKPCRLDEMRATSAKHHTGRHRIECRRYLPPRPPAEGYRRADTDDIVLDA